jgi:hypothetical protein
VIFVAFVAAAVGRIRRASKGRRRTRLRRADGSGATHTKFTKTTKKTNSRFVIFVIFVAFVAAAVGRLRRASKGRAATRLRRAAGTQVRCVRMFATATMAARIEKAEAGVAAEFAEGARASGKDVLLEPIAGTTAVYGGPGEPFNKIVGLGFAAPLDEAALAALEAKYDARGAEIRVEQATLGDPGVTIMLTRRGYELAGYENVLGLALTPPLVDEMSRRLAQDAAAGLAITRVDDAEMTLWIETVADGFLQPDDRDGPPPTESFSRETLIGVYEGLIRARSNVLYLARRGGAIAGGGSVRISDGLAQLSGAATLVPHRRRGVQSALLRARLVDAAARGCDLAVVTTEPASKSQQNVQRAGFSLLYSRAILVRRARR